MHNIYEGVAKGHFPANERKPFEAIVRMNQTGCYEGLGLYDSKKNLVAYALYVKTLDGSARLLDYYAVLEEYRSNGVGSVFLEKMKSWYEDSPCIILETEDIFTASNEDEKNERSRRNGFYLRNGVIETDIHVSYFQADYQIFYLPIREELSKEQILAALEKIYRVMFGEKMERIIQYREL